VLLLLLLLRRRLVIVRLVLLWQRWLIVVKVGIVLLLEHEVLFPVLLPDGSKSVNVFFKLLPRRLLLYRVRQPRLEVLNQLVIGDSSVGLC
jgi:hypothetical protein